MHNADTQGLDKVEIARGGMTLRVGDRTDYQHTNQIAVFVLVRRAPRRHVLTSGLSH
jgi:hypothetical protein